jgi:hypothetical protein
VSARGGAWSCVHAGMQAGRAECIDAPALHGPRERAARTLPCTPFVPVGAGDLPGVEGPQFHTHVLPLAPGFSDYLDYLFRQRRLGRSPVNAAPFAGDPAPPGPSNAVAGPAAARLSLPKCKRGRPSKADVLHRERLVAAMKAAGESAGPSMPGMGHGGGLPGAVPPLHPQPIPAAPHTAPAAAGDGAAGRDVGSTRRRRGRPRKDAAAVPPRTAHGVGSDPQRTGPAAAGTMSTARTEQALRGTKVMLQQVQTVGPSAGGQGEMVGVPEEAVMAMTQERPTDSASGETASDLRYRGVFFKPCFVSP